MSNAAPVLKGRIAFTALNEGMTFDWEPEQRARDGQNPMVFIDRVTDTLPYNIVRKVKNRWSDEIWPWDP